MQACASGLLSRWPYSGWCYLESEHCDNLVDCADGSDEANCPDHSCAEGTFRCVIGEWVQCLDEAYLCNRHVDCVGGTDEENCDYTCSIGYFPCVNDTLINTRPYATPHEYCFPMHYRCDGQSQCHDDTDEADCNGRTCGSNEVACLDGYDLITREMCIGDRYWCDLVADCSDDSDEEHCPYTCDEGFFKCESGSLANDPQRGFCVPDHFLCNSVTDCLDNSDESNCDVVCSADQIVCVEYLNEDRTVRCLSSDFQCDGYADCDSQYDEYGCTYTCPDGKFSCDSGLPNHHQGPCLYDWERCDDFTGECKVIVTLPKRDDCIKC